MSTRKRLFVPMCERDIRQAKHSVIDTGIPRDAAIPTCLLHIYLLTLVCSSKMCRPHKQEDGCRAVSGIKLPVSEIQLSRSCRAGEGTVNFIAVKDVVCKRRVGDGELNRTIRFYSCNKTSIL